MFIETETQISWKQTMGERKLILLTLLVERWPITLIFQGPFFFFFEGNSDEALRFTVIVIY